MTTRYLSLSEMADYLGYSVNTVKTWDRNNLLPSPNVTLGTTTTSTLRLWSKTRVRRLMLCRRNQRGTQHDWMLDTIPHYLNTTGVAQMLGRSENTVKWWVREGILPPADVIGGRTKGWSEGSIREWVLRGRVRERCARREAAVRPS